MLFKPQIVTEQNNFNLQVLGHSKMNYSLEQALSPNIQNKVFYTSNYYQKESITILSFMKIVLLQLFLQPNCSDTILLIKKFKLLKFYNG